MGNRIIVCGGNGAGKSTLAPVLADTLGYPFKDIEDYYYPHRKAHGPYTEARSREEVSRLLLQDLNDYDDFILAAVKGSYGAGVECRFTSAVYVDVPKELRLKRVRERSFQKFGNRSMPGGDLYESEQEFFDMVEKRSAQAVLNWLQSLRIPILPVDGTQPPERNAAITRKWLESGTIQQ